MMLLWLSFSLFQGKWHIQEILARYGQLTPLILVTYEAEMGKFVVGGKPEQIVQ
jgi:hypothetical protein